MIQQSFFWVFTQRNERHNLKRYSHPHVCHSIIYNSQDMETKKRPWCWERLGAGGEGDEKGWDGRMASPTQKDMSLSKLWELAFCELKKTRYSKLRNLALFYVWEDLRGWAHWNHSLHTQLSSLGAVTCVFHILPSSVLTTGSGFKLMAARLQVFFSFLNGASVVAQIVKNLSEMQETWLDPGIRKIPWKREWLHIPGFLPGKFQGQRSLVGCSPWGLRKSRTWLND